jgi:hypothetical protein
LEIFSSALRDASAKADEQNQDSWEAEFDEKIHDNFLQAQVYVEGPMRKPKGTFAKKDGGAAQADKSIEQGNAFAKVVTAENIDDILDDMFEDISGDYVGGGGVAVAFAYAN